MNKNSREKAWKATAEKNSINFVDDISNLNNDDSFAPINEEEERQPLTEEEKAEVRKKLFILLIVIVAVLIFLLVVLIFDPFSSKENIKKKDNDTEEKVEDEDEKEEEKDPTLASLPDGAIELTNKEIQTLMNEIQYETNEYYENDTISLYLSGNTNISALNNANKLFLMTKTADFNSLVKKSINDNNLCGNKIILETSSVQSILKDRFNTAVTTYDNFIYSYYKEGTYITTYKFTNVNGTYEGSCYTPSNVVNQLSQQQVVKATKEGNKLYIDAKVVFVKEDGVYKDPTFKTLITSDKTAVFEYYINSGNTYRYTYDISGVNYILTNVSLLK